MAYHGPPQYGQAHNYPTAPGTGYPEDPAKCAYGQGQPQAGYIQGQPQGSYGQPPPVMHVAVPGAFDRNESSNVRDPSKYEYGQGYPQPGYGYGQPVAHVSIPHAYGRDAPPAYTPNQPPHSTYTTNFSDYAPGQNSSDMGGFTAASFSDKAIRRAFIRKVYLLLTAQLLVTIGFIALFIFVEPVKIWVRTDGLWCYIVAYVTFLITYIVLVCCPSVRRQSPGNFICLAVFTVAFSYLAATISSFHDTNIVLLAAGITGAVCLAISLFAIQTKIDFTMCSGLLFALMMVLFFFGWACLITYYIWGYNRIMDTVYAGLGALVFALFLVYDTQMIIGGKKHEMSPEEYIYGALQLYIDVVYIFLFLLSLMGKKN